MTEEQDEYRQMIGREQVEGAERWQDKDDDEHRDDDDDEE